MNKEIDYYKDRKDNTNIFLQTDEQKVAMSIVYV